MYTYQVEHTDTFGGEANYSWVKRFEVKASSMLGAVRMAKKELGFAGHPCQREDYGDMVALKPRGFCQVIFIS